MTLAELIKNEGRTQDWVRSQLALKGIERGKSYFNEWCNDHYAPKDEYIYIAIAEVLDKDVGEIKACFSKFAEA